MKKNYLKIINALGKKRIALDESLAAHTTFKIGGPADLYYETKTESELVEAVNKAKENNVAYFILAGGSNILVGDKGFRGMVVKIKNQKSKIKNDTVRAEAGVPMALVLQKAMENDLTGLEFLAGVPGTIGGAVRGNAGAWQQTVGDKIRRVKILTEDGEIKWLKKSDCQFGYRQSRFKKNKEIVLKVELELEKGDKKEIEKRIKENLQKRTSQPKEPSAGSVFKNPQDQTAGALIDQCGLKGEKAGKAQISPKHGNFIVNLGGGRASDILQLINLCKKKVFKKFKIKLEEEIMLVGEF